jgi:hypothetical protein
MAVGIPPRKWASGKPLAGFWGGLFIGLGVALVIHQLSWWVLDVNTLVIFPVLSGLLFAGRAWLGQPHR